MHTWYNINMTKTTIKKLKIKSIKPHTNFAEEIYQSQKTDRFFDRILIVTYVILVILAITLIIVNIK